MTSLSGKVALITGGANGIGRATAELFGELGAAVVIADLAIDTAREVAGGIGNGSFAVQLNVTDPQAWAAAIAETKEKLGGLDILVLNAGVMLRPAGDPILNDPLPYMTQGNFEKVVAVNIAGVFQGIMAALPAMEGREGATILCTSSAAGVVPYPRDPVYAMSKFAVVGLASSLGAPLAERGVRILTVCPNGIETTMCPPDLAEKKLSEDSFSTPRFMAEATLHIYEQGKTGEVWLGGGKRAPYRYDPTPLAQH